MHPKIKQVYDQGLAPEKLFFVRRFYIQDPVRNSFEI